MGIEIKTDKLQEEIDKNSLDIRSDSITMSIGELASMYADNDLILAIDFNRFDRWDINQKSRFIESILLGLPLPTIFVFQDKNGTWTIIDGLQRLSTIFEFMGILENKPPLKLVATKYLESLQDKVWQNEDEKTNSLTAQQRIFIKRARMDIQIILREDNISAQYEIFTRINTGGISLTKQEVRNAMLLQTNPTLYKWLETLEVYEAFQNTVSNTIYENSKELQYQKELLLKFLIFKNIEAKELKKIRQFSDFINEESIKLAQDKEFDYEKERKEFEFLFKKLDNALGENVFRRYNKEKEKFEGAFTVYMYEILALGLAPYLEKLEKISDEELAIIIIDMWKAKEKNIYELRAGKNLNLRIYNTIDFGRGYFAAILK
ncbi:Protein of unknown function DUF262 [Bernardetia litoralis DSM 6794]|uniref:GmrSD restriction endonucleases N-terminal domain-containing protein n=1 Tax=Bernardetia litoralis (strain ATCC 23117 / DSM 6794 / NBRC 15988 / NCIMB 1366 / Fx l1 / Sio-4) TaxID=880071 RepID=I4ALQ8_BERLS|nr:DUF262 domain-containing protein [Bernardetia litoralis]AFM04893.1 Protein of unknown function DUF262 [Bernardetia litoralis DSM 6794]